MPKLKKKSANQKRIDRNERMTKLREDEEISKKLRELNKKSKAIKRLDSGVRLADRKINCLSQRKRLANADKAAAHREIVRESQKKRLSDPNQRAVLLQRKNASQSKRLANPESRRVHRERAKALQSKRLANPESRRVHREREKASQSKRLANPQNRDTHRKINKSCQSKRLVNPEKRLEQQEKEKACQSKRLANPESRRVHREREKASQSKRLANPESRRVHREREKASQSKRLLNPHNRETHRKINKSCQSKRLANTEKRLEQRERVKACQSKRLAIPERRVEHRERIKLCQKTRLAEISKRHSHRKRDKENKRKKYQAPEQRIILRRQLSQSQKKRLSQINKLRLHLRRLKKNNAKRLRENNNQESQRVLKAYYKSKSEKAFAKKQSLINMYLKEIKDGPYWNCACCSRLWFRHSVKYFSVADLIHRNVSLDLLFRCCPNRVSADELGYLCTTCSRCLVSGKVPKLSLFYEDLIFPVIPQELMALSQLEERFLAPRIPFMQIYSVCGNQQLAVRGRVVNVPTDVQDSINILPRLPNQTDIVAVALKKKKSFSSNYLFENVRPNIILKALEFLKSCPVYQEAGVSINYNRIHHASSNAGRTLEGEVEESTLHSEDSESDDDPTPWNIPDNETLLFSEAIVFAPGENLRPLPLFLDTHAESMSFIKIYAGQLRTIPKHLSYQDWVKSEVMRCDRRCALVSKLFYCSLKLRAQKIASSINFCLRKTKGVPNINVKQALCEDFTNQLALHNSGYKVFAPDRGSPAFWEQKKKEVFAMIRQLGPPTFFITLSPAETKWPELIVILKKVVDKEEIIESEALGLSYDQKARLIKEDPVTCARYFDYRLRRLFSLIKDKNVFFNDHPVIDFYLRVEFQQRGSPHIHGLLWLDNAPHFKEGDIDNNVLCTKFIDKYITCCSVGLPEDLIQFQRHKHTFTCRKKTNKGKKCRFGIPFYPMDQTVILEPLDESISPEYKIILKNNIIKIKNILQSFYKDGTLISFQNFLDKIPLSQSEYLMSVRSTLKRPAVFLKRLPSDIRINSFYKDILEVHRANMDIQFITDTWSCAMYVLNYINKSKRGISRLLHDAVEEVKKGDFTIREQLRFMANKFLNASEFSAQEAVYYVLSLPLSMCSRSCIFINTGRPESRILILKRKELLKKLPENDTNIFQKNILDHYVQRPDRLNGICLAEFAGYYEYSTSRQTRKTSESNDDISDPDDISLRLLDRSGFIKERKKSKIIRYTRFNFQNDEENYFREQLMLFTPWRDEESELLNVDVRVKFLALKDSLFENRSKFVYTSEENDFEDVIEAAIRAHQDINHESDEDEVDAINQNKQTEYEVLRDRVDEGDILVDLGADLGNKQDLTLPIPHLVSEDRFKEIVLSLNDKQRRYLIHLLHLLKTNDGPVYECILGGAGVGKSRLIEALHQTILRYYNKSIGAQLNLIKVLLCAPTGKAAFAIKGSTLHSAFALPLNQFSHGMPPLSSSVSNTLLSQLHQLKLIIMDEVSMIGSKTLGQIDQRLRQIFRLDTLFAGKSIVLFGDFNQLSPVADRFIFQPDPTNPYKELIGNPLWDLFKFYKLTEIMRQKDDLSFASALNNLAVGDLTPEEVALFKSREVDDISSIPSDTLRLFRTNAEVHLYNESVFAVYPNVVIVDAVDQVVGTVSDLVKSKLLNAVKIADLHKTYSLPTTLKLGVDLHFMITNNISVSDGLVNGAVGILKFIELGPDKNVIRLWMFFQETHVGKDCRGSFTKISNRLGINPGWTPISMLSRNIRLWESSPAIVTRRQFPVIPAEAITIHKSQGGTYSSVAIHLRSGLRRNELYVAFSRATKLSGLYLVGQFKPPNPPKPNDIVQNIIRDVLVSKHISFSVPFLQDSSNLSLIFHNVQSLNAHYPYVKADKCYTSASLIILVETWSKSSDNFPLDNYVEIHRADVQKPYRHGYGMLLYCHKHLLNQVKVLAHFNSEEKSKSFNLVLIKLTDIYVCAGYKPPSTPLHVIINHLKNIFDIALENHQSKLIVFGDFNIDLMSTSHQTFSSLFREVHLENKIPNRISTDGLTQLDICFSNIASLKALYYESFFSYHKPIVSYLADDVLPEVVSSSVVDGQENINLTVPTPTPSTSFACERSILNSPSSISEDSILPPPCFYNKDGVSCYANSACQVLLSNSLIREAILGDSERNELTRLASNYFSGNILDTRALRSEVSMKTQALEFSLNEQQDVVEFISHMAIAFPIVKQFAYHNIEIEYCCDSCLYHSSRSQENLVLLVTGISGETTLSGMLASEYGCWKSIDGSCPSCSSNLLKSRETILPRNDSLKVLILQLALFEQAIPGRISKKKIPLDKLSLELVNISGQNYQVSGIIAHHGNSVFSGHYTCQVRLHRGKWFNCNDTIVTPCSPDFNNSYVIILIPIVT